MPILGYGVFQISAQECEKNVVDALHRGYRLLDTAQSYGNEEGVGNGIVKSGIARNDIFITTKIWLNNAGFEKAQKSIDESLKKLKTDYIDLLLIHQPFNDYYGTYRAMEEAYKAGKARAIGVSNFYPDRLIDLTHFVDIKPAVNQIETHVFQQQKVAREIMAKYHVQPMSWGPFAEGRNDFFTHPVLQKIAHAHTKSVAQIALRFLIQQGIVVIPKSVQKARMLENIDVFNFALSHDEMVMIAELDTGQSLFFSHQDPNTVEWFMSVADKR